MGQRQQGTKDDPESTATDGGVAVSTASDAPSSPPSTDATFELPTDAGTARMRVPEMATAAEAAAVAAAVAAHLSETGDEEVDDRVDPWTLANRCGVTDVRLGGSCARGDEWKLAARCSV